MAITVFKAFAHSNQQQMTKMVLFRRQLYLVDFLVAATFTPRYDMMFFYRPEQYPVFSPFDNSVINSLVIQLEPLVSRRSTEFMTELSNGLKTGYCSGR